MGQERDEPMKHTELRAGIDKTRADMSGTINAIEERLSPSHLREQVMEQIEIAKGSLSEMAKEELREAKAGVKEELREVKQVVKDEILEAKQALKDEIVGAKQEIKHEYEVAKAAVRAATIGKVETMVHSASDTMSEAKTTIVDTIRANPIPAALVGVGLVWMIMNARSSPSRRSNGIRVGGGGAMNDSQIGVVERGQQVASRALHRAQDVTTQAAGKVRDAAGAAGDAVGAFAHDAKDTVVELAHRTQDTVGTLATQTAQTAHKVEQRFETTLHDNPIAIGAMAFALGTAVGLALPSSQREDALMGQVRDQLFEKAEHAAHDAVSAAEEKVTQALAAAKTGGADGKSDGKPKALDHRNA